jgi:hypothetical protein
MKLNNLKNKKIYIIIMSKKLLSLLNINIVRDESSEDEATTKKEGDYPKFYMIPNNEYPKLSREYLYSKIKFLTYLHRKEENKIFDSRIGWGTIYEYFFEKYFFILPEKKSQSTFLNLKEIEVRIRKVIGKIGKKYYQGERKDKHFDILYKIQYNPPASTWFAHNVIKDPVNILIGQNEENTFMSQMVNKFSNYENKKLQNVEVKEVKSMLQRKDELEKKKKKAEKGRRKSMIELEKFNIVPKKENRLFVDSVALKLEKITIGEKKNGKDETQLTLQAELIPKGAKKIIEKFINKFPNNNKNVVEDELNNIQNDEKVYEVETRNSKMFENKFLDSKRFLIDFHHLKSIAEKEKKSTTFNMKNEMERMLREIDSVIEQVEKIDDLNEN